MAKSQKEVTGWIGFAGFVMILAGVSGIFEGLTAIVRSSFYAVVPNTLFNASVPTWGWIHLVLSVFVLLAGFAVLSGKMWGRMVGVVFALLSAITYMAFIPYYPIWSCLIIAMDVVVIYALFVHGDELDG
ncbi:MAG TPA: hypothetical protein VMR76_00280 [Candidatus Saccharimonadia bacterium]|nr:hypothetical protein [Candidatus Saccharimonadia bacterium]